MFPDVCPVGHGIGDRGRPGACLTGRARNNAAFERLRTDMANQKAWIAALVFGAVVSGITLGISFAV